MYIAETCNLLYDNTIKKLQRDFAASAKEALNNMKNPVITFLLGVVMLAAGLFWLTSIVQVSSLWGRGFNISGVNISSGLTLVPLIAGIVWVFFNPKSLGAKLLCVVGGVIIIASILMSVRFHVARVSLFEFILVFVGIAGGGGLIARVLFTGSDKNPPPDNNNRRQ